MNTVTPHVFEASFDLAADRARVFAALTEPDQLRRWFAEHVDAEPEVGGAFRFWGRHTAHVLGEDLADQRITEFEPGVRFAFDWTWGGTRTRVTFELSGGGDETRLVARQEAEGDIAGHAPGDVRWVMEDFWRLSIGNLRRYLRVGEPALRPDHSEQKGDVEVAIEIDAPVRTVWRLLTDPAELDKWIGKGSKIELRVGGAYSYGWADLPEMQESKCVGPTKILEIEPERRLVHDWDYEGGATDRTEWTLEPLEGGRTRLSVRQIGTAKASEYSGYTNGWAKFLIDIAEWARGERPTGC